MSLVRIASAFPGSPTLPPYEQSVFGPQSFPASPQRLSNHRRGRSHRENKDPLAAVLRTLKSFFPGGNLDSLARDFYAVAIGFSPGFVIPLATVSKLDTDRLTVELSKALKTSEVVFLANPASDSLLVAHSITLARHATEFLADEDATIFMTSVDGKAHVTQNVDFMHAFCRYIIDVLSATNLQIVDMNSLGWSEAAIGVNMQTIGEWIQLFPVCYVPPATDGGRGDALQNEMCFTLQVLVEGNHECNDHRFGVCSIPAALFPYDSLSRVTEQSVLLGSKGGPSLFSLQDKLQTQMFDRLNSSEAAQKIWLDVEVLSAGPSVTNF